MLCFKRPRNVLAFRLGPILSLVLGCGGGGGNNPPQVPPPSGLTYSSNPATYTRSVAIPPNTPSSGGGAVVSYSVSPALPAGLALITSTGIINGTPTAITPLATYTLTATNPGGNTIANLTVTVNDVAPSIAYGSSNDSFPINVAIATLTPTNSGGAVVTWAITPALPPGLNFSTANGSISGTPTALTPTTAFTISATNSGGSSPVMLTLAVVNPNPPTPPTITTQPINQSVTVGATGTFAVAATATPPADPLTYQWRVNKGTGFVSVSVGDGAGGSTPNFTTVPTTLAMSGYFFQCQVTDAINALSVTSGSAALTVNPSRWLTMYYPSYQQFLMPPAEVDYTAMTHLIHWPVLPKPDGTLDTASTDFTLAHSQDVVTRAHAAGVKVLLGIGGNQDSGATAGFRGATSAPNRANFIGNIVSLMQARGYDGVDINWEVIRNIDTPQFTAFIQELRAALNQILPRPLLTLPPDSGTDFVPALVASVQQHLDQINIQTYVMSGAYPGWVTWFNSPIQNGGFTFPSTPTEKVPSIDDLVNRFTAAGVAPSKLAIGIQFDGFVWAGGSGTDTGGVTKPRQSWDRSASKPDGSDIGAPQVTTVRYADLVTTLTPAQGYQAFFDAVAMVPWLGRDMPGNADDRFVSYDDEEAIRQKALYVRSKGLGGVFIFEVSGDYFPARPAGQRHPLMSAAKVYVKDGFVNGLK